MATAYKNFYVSDRILSKLTNFSKTGLPCVSFSRKNHELQCQSFCCCNVGLNTEPSQVVQAILIHDGHEIICDELMLAEASLY